MKEQPSHANGFDLPEFWRLLEDLEEGLLDEKQGAGLAALLEQSPAARRAYLEYFQQSAVLRMEAVQWQERDCLPPTVLAMPTRRPQHRLLLAAAALVALSAIMAALVVRAPDRNAKTHHASRGHAQAVAPAHLAATAAAETRWSIDGVDQGTDDRTVSVIEGSTVKVLSGTLSLRLASGALLVLQGPADVSFPTVHRPQLRHGWLWIDAEGSALPFQIETPSVLVRDLGTRFGVRVTDDGGVETHLVSGRIEVLSGNSGKQLAHLGKAGTARAFSTEGRMEERPSAVDPFSALPKLLGQSAGYRTTVLGQSPVGYWPLDDAPGDSLANEIPGSSIGRLDMDVRIGEPGMGRSGGFSGFAAEGHSLYLDGSVSRPVIYHIDGLHGVNRREGAVSFWIRRPTGLPERDEMLWLAGPGDENTLMPPYQAILHTALTASGHVVFAIENEDADVSLASSRTIADGRWHQVVASWGSKSVDLFIDGRLAATDNEPRVLGEANFRGRHVRFGKPTPDQFASFHSYTGWVDEIALWDRPLTAAEVDIQFRSAVGSVPTRPAGK